MFAYVGTFTGQFLSKVVCSDNWTLQLDTSLNDLGICSRSQTLDNAKTSVFIFSQFFLTDLDEIQ